MNEEESIEQILANMQRIHEKRETIIKGMATTLEKAGGK